MIDAIALLSRIVLGHENRKKSTDFHSFKKFKQFAGNISVLLTRTSRLMVNRIAIQKLYILIGQPPLLVLNILHMNVKK